MSTPDARSAMSAIVPDLATLCRNHLSRTLPRSCDGAALEAQFTAWMEAAEDAWTTGAAAHRPGTATMDPPRAARAESEEPRPKRRARKGTPAPAPEAAAPVPAPAPVPEAAAPFMAPVSPDDEREDRAPELPTEEP